MKYATSLALQPMHTAPKVESPDRLLVVDEFLEMGKPIRVWRLVYWHAAWDGQPASWCANGWGDFRQPVGWVAVLRGAAKLSDRALQKLLPVQAPERLSYELLLDADDDADLQYKSGSPRAELSASFGGATPQECHAKLRAFLKQVTVLARRNKDGYAEELKGYLEELAQESDPEDFHRGGNRTVRYQRVLAHDHVL